MYHTSFVAQNWCFWCRSFIRHAICIIASPLAYHTCRNLVTPKCTFEPNNTLPGCPFQLNFELICFWIFSFHWSYSQLIEPVWEARVLLLLFICCALKLGSQCFVCQGCTRLGSFARIIPWKYLIRPLDFLFFSINRSPTYAKRPIQDRIKIVL